MIDFVRCWLEDVKLVEIWREKGILRGTHNAQSFEINDLPLYGEENGIVLGVEKSKKYLKDPSIPPCINYFFKGSPHIYWNNGLHNYNDFKLSNLIAVFICLFAKYEINPFNARLRSFEFGVNVVVPFDLHEFFTQSLFLHRGKGPDIKKLSKSKEYLIIFTHSYYDIKFYYKGIQYNQHNNLLRIEIRVKKLDHVKDLDIQYLSDIMDHHKLEGLGKLLFKNFNELSIYDNINIPGNMSVKEKQKLLKWNNPNHWYHCFSARERMNHKKLVKKYGLNIRQKIISHLLLSKWNELIKFDNEVWSLQEMFFVAIDEKKKQSSDHSSNVLSSDNIHNHNKESEGSPMEMHDTPLHSPGNNAKKSRSKPRRKRRILNPRYKKKINRNQEESLFDTSPYIRHTSKQIKIPPREDENMIAAKGL